MADDFQKEPQCRRIKFFSRKGLHVLYAAGNYRTECLSLHTFFNLGLPSIKMVSSMCFSPCGSSPEWISVTEVVTETPRLINIAVAVIIRSKYYVPE